jgi:hypothetical protein
VSHRVWKGGGALAVIGVLVLLAVGSQAGAASLSGYIVQLSDPPLASYRGGVVGLQATNPAAIGAVKLNSTSSASKA